jgi:hypothetical protein
MQILLSLLVPALADGHLPREFKDDENVVHKIKQDKPKILIEAQQVLSMLHFGVGKDQLYATHGPFSTSGSNYGGVYANGNQADHGTHEDALFELEHWPSHPNKDEMKVLEGIRSKGLDLSPCSVSNFWCTALDWEVFNSKGWPDVIIHFEYDSYAYGDADGQFLGNASQRNIPVIKIFNSAPPPKTGDDRIPRSYIEVTRRMEELAIALGADSDTAKGAVKEGKIAFCKAADEFKLVAKAATDRGVRALGGYFPYRGDDANRADGMNADGVSINGWLYGPARSQTLLMFEELGMSILHVGATGGTEANPYMFPDNLTSIQPGNPAFGVDFFLPDIRVWLDVSSAQFAKAWPHPAITAGQFASFSSYAHSYVVGAKILDAVSDKLKDAKKLDTITCDVCSAHATKCTDVEVISSEVHRSDGLGVTEFACYNPVEYSWCPPTPSPTPSPDSEDSIAAVAAVGLMLAAWA